MANEIDKIELRSEEVQDILTRVPHWMIRYGNLVFLSLILLLFFLSWLIKYPDVLTSEALVTTQAPPQKEFARTSGRIAHILVENNSTIVQNQPLAILDNPAHFQDVFFLKNILDTISIQGSSFHFPMNELPVLFLGDLETDFAVFQNNYIQYDLNRTLQPFNNEALANRLTESELRSRVTLMEAQKEINKRELDFKKTELDRYESLFKKGVIASQEYEMKQLEYLQADRNFRNMGVSISQLKESISNAKRNTRGTEISRTKEELVLLKSVLQSFNQLKKAIRDWELQYAFISNIDGKISFIEAWNENQTITTGDLLFTIVPTGKNNYLARLKTPAQNSGKIKVGQRVLIRLQNFPEEEFGMLTGKVKTISFLPDKDGLYAIEVSLPAKLITTYNKEIDFTQELQGSAEIVTEDLRLIERFFYQLRGIFDN
ncbi:MAG: HlyD family secretion protein [Flavobacteriaceae bacterium CG18_big_fil_WC_8_21_14_2_50_34_36]|nr:HlyD family efflux transporter periplasmic adaptor subunit [Flavobacteriia bacterium]NCT18050.1 HlyD family efflux transporter periplasmic adaptor subunit [Flavobacteriia bacterium]PIQ17193.1 MAG: HlyD family secretion protein [Flavobacteriaceae bacterium CG18_big_fil_WC_8_21_14_2_50_34_36]PJC08213.1 MAG: HlyD family secretion protein [Flavobacteriaceae bacterium CG_4_9_14_0_8_um_filter_34_30]